MYTLASLVRCSSMHFQQDFKDKYEDRSQKEIQVKAILNKVLGVSKNFKIGARFDVSKEKEPGKAELINMAKAITALSEGIDLLPQLKNFSVIQSIIVRYFSLFEESLTKALYMRFIHGASKCHLISTEALV